MSLNHIGGGVGGEVVGGEGGGGVVRGRGGREGYDDYDSEEEELREEEE